MTYRARVRRVRSGRASGSRALAAALVVLLASGLVDAAPAVAVDDPLLQRALTLLAQRGWAPEAVRRLRAGTLSGKHAGWLDARVALEGDGRLTYEVLNEGGSSRTRQKVLRAVLEAERDTMARPEQTALLPVNYTFEREGVADDGSVRYRVRARRSDHRLINGILTVSADGRPLALEGQLAKSPSFWVRSVTIIQRFTTIENVALPVTIESLADVRLVGPAAFSMAYEYREVGGPILTVATPSAAPPQDTTPSTRLLALHAAFKSVHD